ncbi:hypothetical protein T492DRAFT_1048822 [Pavlovales sp. CCMP2436]|nr:hypothetical protein T492DRAFT_1048822 [Pavlovales sp. CCMP2436]
MRAHLPPATHLRTAAERLAVLALCLSVQLGSPPGPLAARADGFDEALRVCPDDRIACVSSLDPSHFLEPWELPGKPGGRMVDEVARLAAIMGGEVSRDQPSERGAGLHVRWARDSDETVLWFPSDDAVVHFRSESTDGSVLWDIGRNRNRIEEMRRKLHLAKVPVVRNRRAFADERLANGEYRLREERPWLQQPGSRLLYGEDGAMQEDAPEAGPIKMLFPFARVGARGSLTDGLLQDARGFSALGDFSRAGAPSR